MRRAAFLFSFGFLALMAAGIFPSAQRAAAAGYVQGRVVDREDGTPIANAAVVVGAQLVAGATPPPFVPRGDVATTTDAAGNFALPALPRGAYLSILTADGHAALHVRVAGAYGPLVYRLLRPTPAEVAWLRQLNADRAANGATIPLVFDELAEETARYRAAHMASTGAYEHDDAFTHYEGLGGIYPSYNGGAAAENIDAIYAPSNWRDAERDFMIEKCNLFRSCDGGPIFGGETGHYQAIVNPKATWAGIAAVPNGKPPSDAGPGATDYYAELFVDAS